MKRLLLILIGLGCSAAVFGHQFAPALLELEEKAAESVEVRWKQPVVRVQGSRLRPVLPVECRGVGEPVVNREGTGLKARWLIECPGGLAGKTVGVEGIASSKADVLLRVALRDGRNLRQVLKAETPNFTIATDAGRWGVFRSYLILGVEHLLSGLDHLLFVLGLLLLIGWGRSLIWTITAFTLGHSVTLALASLGLVSAPSAPIEALIAFSIYALAVELTLRPEQSFTRRRPWLVAGGFGLLHGLGFAGALSEVGLPPTEIPLALFSFNVGIELGQLLFVAAILLLIQGLQRLPLSWPSWSRALPAYGIGSFAIFWLCERVMAV
jgi:hydrogenase/urease accessory protein HupE